MSIRSAIASTSRIIPPLASSSRCFTTTPLVLAEQKKKSTVATVKKRQVAGFSGVKKKSGTQRSSGARVKSLKLSYAMASETPDLGDLKILENGNAVAQHVGAPTTFSKKTFVKLATMGLPRKLEKELDASGQPASIIRQLTVEMADKLADGDQKSSSENKYVLSGESGSGKSVLLLQTVSLAYAADWIVIYAPRAFEWTDGTSPYRYNPSTQMFDQPAIAESMLQGFSSVNGAVLSKIKTEEGTDLARICKNALSGGDTIKALETCLDTIAKQTEYPVLFAVDDVQALYAATKYKNPQFETLQSYNFSVPRLALNFLSGRKNLARGMVVSAYSHTTPNVPLSPEFSYALELDSTRPITPYTKMDPAHLAHATAPATKIEVPFGLSTQEAAGMFELWSRRGWTLKSSDEMFMGAFTAAMGNPREFGRGLRFTRQATEHY